MTKQDDCLAEYFDDLGTPDGPQRLERIALFFEGRTFWRGDLSNGRRHDGCTSVKSRF